jgi:hypothetical protein
MFPLVHAPWEKYGIARPHEVGEDRGLGSLTDIDRMVFEDRRP